MADCVKADWGSCPGAELGPQDGGLRLYEMRCSGEARHVQWVNMEHDRGHISRFTALLGVKIKSTSSHAAIVW